MGTKNGDCCSDIYWGWLDSTGRINVSAGAWGTPAKSTNPINDGAWHMVVMTRQLDGRVEMYVDGELQEVQKSEAGVKPLSIHSIGRREDKNSSGDNINFSYVHGLIDQLKVFDKRLAPETVAYLFRFDTPAPVAVDDGLTLMWDEVALLNVVLENDISHHDTPLNILNVTSPAHGQVVRTENGLFEYVPNGQYFGDDQFTYTATDGFKTSTATVFVEVMPTPCDYDCDDGNLCTEDTCDGFGGCVSDGTGITVACDDENACTTEETCQGDASGTCGGGIAVTCIDDGNPCTAETCDPARGCMSDGTGITIACNDGDACTTGDLSR